MRFLILVFLVGINAFACGCLDLGTAGILDKASQANYITGDTNILKQLQAIGSSLQKAYQDQENNSARNVEYSTRLKNEMVMKEKQLLFNTKAINALESLKSDSVSIGAEMKALMTEFPK